MHGGAEIVGREGVADFTDGLIEAEENPLVVAGEEGGVDFPFDLGLLGRGALAGRRGACAPRRTGGRGACATLHLAEAAGVPELVAEVAAQLDVLLVEEHVLAERRAAHGAEAEGVRAVFGDEFERVGGIAEGLRHLAALLVADDAGEIDILERQVAHELVARHDHARDPEENDVGSGDEVGGRVEGAEGGRGGVVGFVAGPAHRGEGPEPGAEPGVEDVGVLFPIFNVCWRLDANIKILMTE